MKAVLPCAIYTRKSTEEGLAQEFNSLDAQREACEAYILSQKEQGWKALPGRYDDGGFSGGNTERPGLKRLLNDIDAKRIRIVVVYKVDRLTRSLADFAKLVERFDAHGVSFVSVTQQFNTTSSMGRLTLHVLLSFAQFEREVTGERIRDKIAASKKKGMWMGGYVPIGYLPKERTLVIDDPQAERVREIYRLYLERGGVRRLQAALDQLGWVTPVRQSRRQNMTGGRPFSRGHLYLILRNPIYIGQIRHRGNVFPGQHPAIIEKDLWRAVQDRLSEQLQGHRGRSHAKNPSLLAGLLFDASGRGLATTYTKKGVRRYRYYVGERRDDADQDCRSLRWPAQDLESAVMRVLVELLDDPSRWMAWLGKVPAAEARRRLALAPRQARQLVDGGSTANTRLAERAALLRRLVHRITMHPDRLEIVVRTEAIGSSGDTLAGEATMLLEVPAELKRCGKAVRLIVRTPGAMNTRHPDAKLIGLLGQAHMWFARLTSGDCHSVHALAEELGLTRAHVSKVIHLAFLAPDVVARILDGNQPPELNARRLIRRVPLPLDWDAQRTGLGMRY